MKFRLIFRDKNGDEFGITMISNTRNMQFIVDNLSIKDHTLVRCYSDFDEPQWKPVREFVKEWKEWNET